MAITLKADGTIDEEIITKTNRTENELRDEVRRIDITVSSLNKKINNLLARRGELNSIINQIVV